MHIKIPAYLTNRIAATLLLLTLAFANFYLSATSVSGDAGQTQSAPNPRRHMYTVLPPPADYKTQSEKSVTLPRLESINYAVDSAGKSTIMLHL